ncbi:hypothetical protein ANANG_G00258480 [Anguilla anguilla]|uniref:Uncharacterized protein n=1 Tax=Anguilla anguilla TaxID=7936 RepID=A0A9D3RKU6_ANGAN|nr:hypothetical protein ANANG_G00258480 [Anguilla anguilla]
MQHPSTPVAGGGRCGVGNREDPLGGIDDSDWSDSLSRKVLHASRWGTALGPASEVFTVPKRYAQLKLYPQILYPRSNMQKFIFKRCDTRILTDSLTTDPHDCLTCSCTDSLRSRTGLAQVRDAACAEMI